MINPLNTVSQYTDRLPIRLSPLIPPLPLSLVKLLLDTDIILGRRRPAVGLPSAFVPTGNNNKAPNYRSTVLTPVLTPLSRPVLNRVNTTFRVSNTVPYSGFTVSTLKPAP